jgi:hypothetical protein
MKTAKAASKKAAAKKPPIEDKYLRIPPATYEIIQRQARHYGFTGVWGEEKALACMVQELVMIRGHLQKGDQYISNSLAAVIAAADPNRATPRTSTKRKKGK